VAPKETKKHVGFNEFEVVRFRVSSIKYRMANNRPSPNLAETDAAFRLPHHQQFILQLAPMSIR
jgi:hypothetical protein